MIEVVGFAVFGYLLGSLPFGVILGRLFGGVDVRDHGSGSTGMTNVLRTAGKPAAALVLLLDMLKGAAAIIAAKLVTGSAGVEVAAGLGAIAGHMWPVFAGFRGGKGVSPGWGGLFPLEPISGIAAGAHRRADHSAYSIRLAWVAGSARCRARRFSRPWPCSAGRTTSTRCTASQAACS